MKKKVKANRILAVLCAFAMIVTLFPGGVFYGDVFAAEGDKTEAVTTEGDVAETEEAKEEPVVTEEEPVEEKAPENAAEPAAPSSDETVQKAEPQEKTESQNKKEEPAAEKTEAEKKTETVSEDKDKTKTEDKKDEEKEADKKDSEEEKLFKVEFDFTDNYARFNKISAKTTDADGVIILPKKPEARKALYKDEAGSEYYFTGWKYKGEEYEPGDKVKLNDDATFKAVWKQTYTVEFSTRGIEAEEIEPQTEVYGEPVVLPDETAAKDGYDFIGWTPDKGDTVFAPDTSISAKRIQPKRSAGKVRLMAAVQDATSPDLKVTYEGDNKFKAAATDNAGGDVELAYAFGLNETPGDEVQNWENAGNNEAEIDTASKTVVVDGEEKDAAYLYVKATDTDGNSVTVSRDLTILEDTKPVVEISTEPSATAANSYTIEFTADDTASGSGVRNKSDIRVEAGGKSFTLDNSDTYTYDSDTKKGSGSFTLKDESLNGDVEVVVYATDACGNEGVSAAKTFKFDSKVPVVTTLSMPEVPEGATAGYYKADNAKVTISVSDDSDIEYVKVIAGSKEVAAVKNGDNYVADMKDLGDGTIDFTIAVKDAAGNETTKAALPESITGATRKDDTTASFVLDTTPPTVKSVSTEPSRYKTVGGKSYYPEVAKTTYEIEEKNPASIKLTYKKDGTADSVEATEETTVEGDWNADGEYTEIKLSATDKAGNQLDAGSYAPTGEDAFAVSDGVASFTNDKIIDTKGPEATVTYKTSAVPYFYNNKVYINDGVTADIEITTDEKDYSLYTVSGSEISSEPMTSNKMEGVVVGKDEGEYSLKVGGRDHAGHPLKITEVTMENLSLKEGSWPASAKTYGAEAALQVSFVIDKTAPKLKSVTTTPGPSQESKENGAFEGMYYHGSEAATTYTIDEENRSMLTLTYKKDGADISVEKKDAESVTGEWKAGDAKNTEYSSIKLCAEDKAGNKLDGEVDDFSVEDWDQETISDGTATFAYGKVIDTMKPGIELTIGDFYKLIAEEGNNEPSLDDDSFSPFRKEKSETINVIANDGSPVRISYDIRVRKDSDKVDQEDEEWPVPYKEIGKSNGFTKNNSADQTVKGEIQFEVVNIVLTDLAGHVREIDNTNIIYLDNTKPKTGVDIIKPQAKVTVATSAITARGPNNQPLYNEKVTVKFSVTDPNKWKSSSGLKYVKYSITVDGDTKVNKNELKRWKVAETRKVGENDKLVYTFTDTLPVSYESNRIKVILYTEDNAGNKSEASTYFGIDTQGPQVVVTYNNNSAQNEKYFKENRTATVTVTERNLGENSNKITIKTQVTVPGSWNYSAGGASSGNSDKWVKKLKYNKDGDYTLSISGTDALGNPASVSYQGTAPKKFTIDKTAPVITVTFDNNNVRNGKYYNANRTATVKIKEHNFRASDVKAPVKATGPRNGRISAPSISGFSSNGDTRRATIPFTKEGSFSFDVKYTDLAGNPAKVVKISEFVIDKTAPVVRIENVVNGGIYGGTVAPRAIFDDDTFNRSDSTFRFTGVRKVDRSELVPSFSPNGEYGGSYVLNDFPYVKVNDDVYTAYATSTDMAGNTTTVSVTFSVNRFGSAYDYNKDKATEDLVAKNTGRYYTNVKTPLQLREFNVNHIKSYELTLNRGGSSVKLEEGKDYTVVKTEGDQGVQYVYKIKDSIITDEGKYEIVARSEDEAGNINSNAAIRAGEDEEDNNSEVPLRFVYDTTAPTVSFVDHDNTSKTITLEEGENGKNKFKNMEKLMLGIVPEDDWALGAIQYVLKDRHGNIIKDSGVIKGDEFWEVMGEDGIRNFLEEIDHGADVKTLEVTIWDAAGNESTQIYKISVTKNLAEQAMANWYWILLVLAAGGGGGYAYYRKRREDGENSEDGEDDAA